MTSFTKEVIDSLNFKDTNDVIQFMEENRENRTRIASLAPIVTKHADLGDAYAKGICDNAIHELVLSVIAVEQKLGLTDPNLVIVGSLANTDSYFKHKLHSILVSSIPSITITAPKIDPALAACRLSNP